MRRPVLRNLAQAARRTKLAEGFGQSNSPPDSRTPRRVCHRSGSGQDGSRGGGPRSEEHTSELQSLMRISYAVFCLKKKNKSHIDYSTLLYPIFTTCIPIIIYLTCIVAQSDVLLHIVCSPSTII